MTQLIRRPFNVFCIAVLHVSVLVLFSTCTVDKRPAAQANWVKLGPGGGGATFIPTFSFQSPDDFLVRCDMTGSYLTNNGGDSYRQFNYPNGASAYAFDPKDKQTIYIGSTFLSRSTDGGKTWNQVFPDKSAIKNVKYQGDHAGYSIETRDISLYNRKYDVNAIRVDPVNAGDRKSVV